MRGHSPAACCEDRNFKDFVFTDLEDDYINCHCSMRKKRGKKASEENCPENIFRTLGLLKYFVQGSNSWLKLMSEESAVQD